MLLAAKTLQHVAERKETAPGKSEASIYGSLAFVEGDVTRLAMNEASYWSLLPLKDD